MTGVLVIGASGLLGQYLVSEAAVRGYAVEGTYSSDPVAGLTKVELADPSKPRSLIAARKPDIVLLPAAMTSVDVCESKPELAGKINSDASLAIARECAAVDARLVYFSTDHVFDGASGPSDEAKPPHPLNVYGRTKLEGERNVLQAHASALVIRTCANFGWNRLRAKENSVTWILNRLRRGEDVGLFVDQWVSPSYVPDVARVTFDLLRRSTSGIVHVASRDCVTRLDMGRQVCDVFDLPRDLLRPTKLADANLLAPRPPRSCLAVSKVERILEIPMSTFSDGLRRMREGE